MGEARGIFLRLIPVYAPAVLERLASLVLPHYDAAYRCWLHEENLSGTPLSVGLMPWPDTLRAKAAEWPRQFHLTFQDEASQWVVGQEESALDFWTRFPQYKGWAWMADGYEHSPTGILPETHQKALDLLQHHRDRISAASRQGQLKPPLLPLMQPDYANETDPPRSWPRS